MSDTRPRAASSVLLGTLILLAAGAAVADPLPSWRDGAAKRASTAFVERTTTPGSRDFVVPEECVYGIPRKRIIDKSGAGP